MRTRGTIELDSEMLFAGVPSSAWAYQLGSRPAFGWILDQYRGTPTESPTIRAKFNKYRFADQKETVIDLLKRITRVSVETMQIVDAMRKEERWQPDVKQATTYALAVRD